MRKTLFPLFLILILSSQVCPGQHPRVLFDDQQAPGTFSFKILIPYSEFKDEVLVGIANDYLSRFKEARLLQVGIYADENSARDSKGKTVFHVTYDYWSREFEQRVQGESVCAAELLKYGQNATLRIRQTSGEIKELKIAGDSAFHPVIGEIELDLLHVSFVNQGFGDAKRVTPHFFFRVPKKLDLNEAQSLTKVFVGLLGESAATLYFREDEWFIFDTFYPWINLFSRAKDPPKLEEAAKSSEFLCSLAQDQTCIQTSIGSR